MPPGLRGAAPGIHAIERAGFPVQIVTLNELADPKTSYMFAAFLTNQRKAGAASVMLARYLEDPANRDLKQLADFLLENELVEPVVMEEVLKMAQRMPAKKREQLFALFNKYPVSREWGERIRTESRLEETRAAILDYLDNRFGQPPGGSAGTLQSVTDLELLEAPPRNFQGRQPSAVPGPDRSSHHQNREKLNAPQAGKSKEAAGKDSEPFRPEPCLASFAQRVATYLFGITGHFPPALTSPFGSAGIPFQSVT